MGHVIRFVQQYSRIVVDPHGRRYVARAYAAHRLDDLWDGWFVFIPFDDGRPLATDRETTQGSLSQVRYWASGITTVYLEGALERAQRLLPEAVLARRRTQAETEETVARAEAAAYEEAAVAARVEALDADRRRREAEALLLAEREAAARAAARVHEQAARSARLDAAYAKRRKREFMRQHSSAQRASEPSVRAQARDRARALRRGKRARASR